MKNSIIFILTVIGLAFSGTNVSLSTKRKAEISERASVDKKIDAFIKDIDPLLKSPMNWCDLEATGKFTILPTDRKSISIIRVEAEMTCNEKMARDFFKSAIERAGKQFLLDNRTKVNYRVSQKYPDMEVIVTKTNVHFASWINYREKFVRDGRSGWEKKTKIFKMVLNDKYISPELKRFTARGNVIDYNSPLNRYSYKQAFDFKVYTKALKGDIVVRFEPLYHITKDEGITIAGGSNF